MNTGKRRSAFITAAVLLLLLLLPGCGAAASEESFHALVPSFPPLQETEGLRIAVASDLHFNPDRRRDGEEASADLYNAELIDALLWDVQQQGATVLLLTGDLCNGGKAQRHTALAEKLKQAEADGLSVFVLPGNHDLAPITQAEFAEFYADFGYTEAYSRDPSSLSYCILWNDMMILMMDTAGYGVGAIDLPDAPGSDSANPFLSDNTLRWAVGMFREAAEKKLHVLAAGHYNLLPEISRNPENTGSYLKNGDLFAELLRRNNVPLYLSGHQHIRAVYQENGLTELLTEYLLAYPTAYSILDISDSELVYTPRRIDVDGWAAESGQDDPVLLNFSQWQQEELQRYSFANVEYMAERNPLSSEEKTQAAEFFYTVMDSYWQGSLYRERDAVKAMAGYTPFFRCAEGYAYGWWLKNLIETSSPLLGGFTLKW